MTAQFAWGVAIAPASFGIFGSALQSATSGWKSPAFTLFTPDRRLSGHDSDEVATV